MASNDDAPVVETSPVFQLKGSLFTLTVLHLLQLDLVALKTQLTDLVKQTPKFFQYMPMVLDLQKINAIATPVDFEGIIECMRGLTIIPVGVRGGNPEQHIAAQRAGLAIFPNAKPVSNANVKTARNENKEEATATLSAPTGMSQSKLITQPVRSGQQIYARNGDLIVLAPVSHGAELLADGNIHVYGILRGRALAGVNGDLNARIFCHSLEAELVAIAGHYWLSEDLQKSATRQNVQIYLENESLHVKNV